MTFVAVPEIQEILSIVKDLQARVGNLEQTRVTPALPAPPAPTATPTAPATERRDVRQWTIRLSEALIAELKRMAYEERLNPSELVERLLRKALS
jgi:Ribbon-helix-helix protein, copG family